LAPAYWSAGHGLPHEAGLLFYQECVRLLDEVTLAEEWPCHAASFGRAADCHLAYVYDHSFIDDSGRFYPRPSGLSLDIATEDRQINMHQPDFDIAIRLGLVPDSTLIARTLARNLTWLCASPTICRNGHAFASC
jgi:DNA-binding transcriptional LysR family regulator